MRISDGDTFVGDALYVDKGNTLLGGTVPKSGQFFGLSFPNRYIVGLDA